MSAAPVPSRAPGPPGPSGRWIAAGALAAVLAGVGLGGYDGHHSDLAIQRTLVLVRRQPHALPGDLVADHALAHPSLLFDLWALLPAPGGDAAALVELGLHAGMLALIGGAVAAAARHLGGGRAGMVAAAVLVVLPRALLAESRLVQPAPLARNLGLGLQLAALAAVLARRPGRAGLLLGLALGVHPTTGLAALPVLGSLAAARGAGLRDLGRAAAALVPVAGVVLLPWAGLGGLAPLAPDQRDWMVLRLAHHLDGRAWQPGAVLAAWLHLGVVALGDRRLLPGALAAAGVVALGGLALPVGLGGLARLHLGYAAAWLAVFALLATLRPRAGRARWLLPLVLAGWVENALVDEVPGGRRPWRAPVLAAPLAPEAPPGDRSAGCLDDAWARVAAGRPVGLALKDGGEVAGSPVFARRWGRRLVAVCGDAAAAPAPPGRGWRQLAARCKHVEPCGEELP